MNKDLVSDEGLSASEQTLHDADRASRWRKFEKTMRESRNRFGSLQTDDLHAIIDEAVTASRQAL